MNELPLVEEIAYLDPVSFFAAIPQNGAIFLDSARQDSNGEYSFIAFDPFKTLVFHQSKDNPFEILQKEWQKFQQPYLPHLPPFQGGIAGMFGYELGGYLEKLPSPKRNDLQIPELIVGFYDLVVAWDHKALKTWIISCGFPETDNKKRRERAKLRRAFALDLVSSCKPLPEHPSLSFKTEPISSTFSQEGYIEAVKKVIEYIRAGDIFEANISQRFSTQIFGAWSGFDLYRHLRHINPAPFAAYFQYGDHIIASASPERFLRLQGDKVQARPIKGTRRRDPDPIKDQLLAAELLESEKDWAENVMIVDLMRNDMSRVCLPHSIKVPKLCGLESFATVHHLVSVVEGQLTPENNAIDLLRNTFPGGSITGAPKIRTMEIIWEIEPTVRGPYCGSMGYIGFNGNMDLSITIRTFALYKNFLTFQTGGAITVDSDPDEEYQETLTKAAALRKVLA